jgi:RHH-type rel operon transcriptional repressor/antitoxin RelB
MSSTTLTVRIEPGVKKRMEKLVKSTGRSRSSLTAEELNEYLDVNEWQVEGIKTAVASLDRGAGIRHEDVKEWVNSWGHKRERKPPKRSLTCRSSGRQKRSMT